MQPKFSEIKQIILFGMSFYGDPFDTHAGWDQENQIGLLWKRFITSLSQYPDFFPGQKQPPVTYEVHIYNEETKEKGVFEVFVGMELNPENIQHVPAGLLVKVLPAVQYAIFTFTGEQINSDWEKILQNWMLTSGYESPYSFNFQYYDERFKGVANLKESALDVYIPIKKVV